MLCNCERGASCTWLSVPTQTFPLAKCHTYNLKAVYKISTGSKYYEFYVKMSPNCSILASIFQNFPGGGMPPGPPGWGVLCTPLPKRLVPWAAPPPLLFYKS